MTGFGPPSGHLWRAPTSIRLRSRSRLFSKGHLWPRGTAILARALSPKRCGLARASLLGPWQSHNDDFAELSALLVSTQGLGRAKPEPRRTDRIILFQTGGFVAWILALPISIALKIP